ncbi:hypothetical protein SCHPADRAFT_602194 [Schizopora paradoxa]|uniref:Uncharacterized protein n=1 Tax=Schizopora paradoxa TaxID=27342 RepID=A0A0H2R9V7_9AGAM|nr:hypothetical protein SCHPADRAFT_602194 [Schizopora paradoxa]
MTEASREAFPRPYSHSPWPAWTVSSLFLSASILPSRIFPNLPPFPQRIGFSAIMYGAGYVLSTGDARNGSGITTAWSLIYLFWNGRRSLVAPRNPVSICLTTATVACASLYGTEYFFLQDSKPEDQTGRIKVASGK